MNETSNSYTTRVVAFVDILGFGRLVELMKEDEKLQHQLQYALQRIHHIKTVSSMQWTVQKGLEVSVFSDSIVISAQHGRLGDIIWTVGWLQAELLYIGILTRGGIAAGLTHHSDGILYGEGMNLAYQIESSAAVYPRVVIDHALLSDISPALRQFVREDFDGLTFVNAFAFDAMSHDAAEFASEGYDPRQIYFQATGEHIRKGLGAAKRLDHVAKWRWVARRFNEVASAYKNMNPDDLIQL